MIRNRRIVGLHLDAWAAVSFLVGYFIAQPVVVDGYALSWRWWA